MSHGQGQGKLLTKKKSRYINKTQIKVCFLKSWPRLVNRNLCLKIIFLSHIFWSFYYNIVCQNVLCEKGLKQIFFSSIKWTIFRCWFNVSVILLLCSVILCSHFRCYHTQCYWPLVAKTNKARRANTFSLNYLWILDEPFLHFGF